jgi:hypothetical protein
MRNTIILPELDTYGIIPEIIEKAREIYTIISDKDRRGNNRKRYIFYCLYHAYMDLGYLVNQDEIASKIGLPKNQISKAKSVIHAKSSTYKPTSIVLHSINDCLGYYYDELFVDRSLFPELVSDVRKITAYDPSINERYPHIIAALTVCIFAENKGCIIDHQVLAEKLYIKWPILAVTYRKIKEIYSKI